MHGYRRGEPTSYFDAENTWILFFVSIKSLKFRWLHSKLAKKSWDWMKREKNTEHIQQKFHIAFYYKRFLWNDLWRVWANTWEFCSFQTNGEKRNEFFNGLNFCFCSIVSIESTEKSTKYQKLINIDKVKRAFNEFSGFFFFFEYSKEASSSF